MIHISPLKKACIGELVSSVLFWLWWQIFLAVDGLLQGFTHLWLTTLWVERLALAQIPGSSPSGTLSRWSTVPHDHLLLCLCVPLTDREVSLRSIFVEHPLAMGTLFPVVQLSLEDVWDTLCLVLVGTVHFWATKLPPELLWLLLPLWHCYRFDDSILRPSWTGSLPWLISGWKLLRPIESGLWFRWCCHPLLAIVLDWWLLTWLQDAWLVTDTHLSRIGHHHIAELAWSHARVVIVTVSDLKVVFVLHLGDHLHFETWL